MLQVPAERVTQLARAPVAFLAVAASATPAAAGCRRDALLPPAAGAAAITAADAGRPDAAATITATTTGPTTNGSHSHDDGDKGGPGAAAKAGVADAVDGAGGAGGQQEQLGQQQVQPQEPQQGQEGVGVRLRPSDLSQALLREDSRLLDLLVGCYEQSYFWGAMPLATAAGQGSSSSAGGSRKGGAGERGTEEDEGRVTNAEELTQKQLEVWHELHSTLLLHHLQVRGRAGAGRADGRTAACSVHASVHGQGARTCVQL